VDNETKSIDLICWLINKYFPQLDIVSCFTSTSDALKELVSLAPDLIILDVKMTRMSGFSFARACQKQMSVKIIFITADHGPLITLMNQMDLIFLFKPVDQGDFENALEKINQSKILKLDDRKLSELNKWI